ncbi:MAG: threonine-phosphate decarboxylase CobD [Pseudomonadota bacterium]
MRDTTADSTARDHGGDLDRAQARYGAGPWLDLSTGINALPYPLPPIAPDAWASLPTRTAIATLEAAARRAYGSGGEAVALAGAQAAIQLVPRLLPPGDARVLAPTYNEHGGALRGQGWQVQEVGTLDALDGADLAVVVNPNNPDGQTHAPAALAGLSQSVGLLIVDESFADAKPGLSLASRIAPETERLIVLRSFGKFYGLAGLRLGFALCGTGHASRLRSLAGPWAVSGPAVVIGQAALSDTAWADATRMRLSAAAARLDALCAQAGWTLVGGTPLFRTYHTPDAGHAQALLARHHVWSRIFPYSPHWIRLGLPGRDEGWRQLSQALRP